MGFLCIFSCFDLTLCSPRYGTREDAAVTSARTPAASALCLESICHTRTSVLIWAPKCDHSTNIFTFSKFFANSTSFHQNLEALPPLLSSSARTCSKLTVPLILSLCLLTEIDNEDVTQIQEGWWDTGLPPNLSHLMEEIKWSYRDPGLTLQKTLSKPQCSHRGMGRTGREVASLKVSA